MRIFIDGPISRVETEAVRQWASDLVSLVFDLGVLRYRRLGLHVELGFAPIDKKTQASQASFALDRCEIESMNPLSEKLEYIAEKAKNAAMLYEEAEGRNSKWFTPRESSVFDLLTGLYESAAGDGSKPGAGMTESGVDQVAYLMSLLRSDDGTTTPESIRESARDLASMLALMHGPQTVDVTYLDDSGDLQGFTGETDDNSINWVFGQAKKIDLKNFRWRGYYYGILGVGAGGLLLGGKITQSGIQVGLRPPKHFENSKFLQPSSQLDRIKNLTANGSSGQFEIQKHTYTDKDGTVRNSYSVILRGTQNWTAGTTNIQDMEANLRIVGNMPTEQQIAVQKAMDAIGIKPTDPVELVGHSQAGGDVAALTRDPVFNKRYNVVSALTVGGPTGTEPPVGNVQMLQVEAAADGVPTLDGAPAPNAPNVTRVVADTDGSGYHPHDIRNYRQVVHYIENTDQKDMQRWMNNRTEQLGLDQEGETTVYTFNTYRKP